MQQLVADTLDDLLIKVFQNILKHGRKVTATKGSNKELAGVVLELTNPLARLSRTETKGTVFSCLGETLWYLSGSNKLEFIKYYLSKYGKFAERNGTVHGAYGPRFFAMRGNVNQIKNIIRLLQAKPASRQAVIQLFNAEDLLKNYNDIPCTCSMQFFVRGDSLELIVHMRSNDAFVGLPHDVFAFTFIQELIARSLNLKLGVYRHMVGSLHIYDSDFAKVKRFLNEGYQSRVAMPQMPVENPWVNLNKLCKVESMFRLGNEVRISRYQASEYWRDLMRLLHVFALNKARRSTRLVKSEMATSVYDSYINKSSRRHA